MDFVRYRIPYQRWTAIYGTTIDRSRFLLMKECTRIDGITTRDKWKACDHQDKLVPIYNIFNIESFEILKIFKILKPFSNFEKFLKILKILKKF